jgi:hypothetical protein
MHDTGKITTPEYVVDKSNKLETIFDRIEMIKTRWQAIRLETLLEAEKIKVTMLKDGADEKKLQAIDDEYEKKIHILNKDLSFLESINRGGEFMDKENLDRLESISNGTFTEDGKTYPFLNENELFNLSIPKGTLTDEERNIINNHALMTTKILKKLPWPKKLLHVPDIAGSHHEKLNGTGYPLGLSSDQINLQSRILAVADIFEALSARDRPYKKPMPLPQVLKILGFMVKDNHIDKDLVDLFISTGLHDSYINEYFSSPLQDNTD